jgi:DNA-binding transcriptional regulator YhcF (GntR family)
MLEVKIDINCHFPVYQQITEEVKRLIDDGQLKPGDQIPSVRDMASWLQLNPSTVARAYHDLKLCGVVATSRRRGTIIIGDRDSFKKSPEIQEHLDWTVNNHLLVNLTRKSRQQEMETAFTLRPAYWRVQRIGG